MLAPTLCIYSKVTLPDDAQLDDYVIVGRPPQGTADGEFETRIGSSCVIRSHTVIYAGNRIGARFQTGHGAMIREHNVIGDDVSVGTQSIVEHHVSIGNGVRLHSRVFVPEYTTLEDKCWLGPGVILTNARYPLSPGAKHSLKGPVIEAGAIVGAGAVILPGVRIGSKALVGAGAVVTRDVPPGAVVVGNPAHIVKHVDDLQAYAETKE
ncbi:MAG: transferase [Chloroflexi bacterium]|nr:transferase [Chloroflexota bacterium]